MKWFLLAFWLLGAVSFAISSYPERCNPREWWMDVPVMALGGATWPLVAAGRAGVWAWSPKMAASPLGCGVVQ